MASLDTETTVTFSHKKSFILKASFQKTIFLCEMNTNLKLPDKRLCFEHFHDEIFKNPFYLKKKAAVCVHW